MKKIIIFLIFVLTNFQTYAQFELKFKTGIGAANSFTMYKTTNAFEKNTLVPNFTFNFGLNNSFQFNSKNINVDIIYLRRSDCVLQNNERVVYNFNNISIPFYLGLMKNKIEYNIGISNNFIIKPKKYDYIEDKFYAKKYNASVYFGLGYNLSEKIQFKIDLFQDFVPFKLIYSLPNFSVEGRKYSCNLMLSLICKIL